MTKNRALLLLALAFLTILAFVGRSRQRTARAAESSLLLEEAWDLLGGTEWRRTIADPSIPADSARLEAVLSDAARLDPGSEMLHRVRAFWHAARGEDEQRVDLLQEGVAAFPDSILMHESLGVALWDLGQLQLAADAFRRVTELNPDDSYPWSALGRVLASMGDEEGALLALRSALAIDPQDVRLHSLLGELLYKSGDYLGARWELQRAIDLEPRNGWCHAQLAFFLALELEYPAALEALRRAVELDPENASHHLQWADLLSEIGDQEQAEERWEIGSSLDPLLAERWYTRGENE